MKQKSLLNSLLFAITILQYSNIAISAVVPPNTQLAPTQDLVRGNGMEVASLDPHKIEGVPESTVSRDLLEGLVTQDGNGNTIPAVATRWETTDNKTFTFYLRQTAKWSNGDPVTAHDFVYSLRRAVDPATASPYSGYIEISTMQNAADIIRGQKSPTALGVKAIDDHTLTITLTSAVPYFVQMLNHAVMSPVHQATVEKWGDKWTKPENFVGNGAYVPANWVVNERLDLTRNSHYWDNAHTIINNVTYLPIENQVAEMNRFLAGEIHLTKIIPVEHFSRLQKQHPESVKVSGNLCTGYAGFNTQKPPFNDVRVRQALSYAIDRQIITKAILGQGEKPAYFLTPDITAGFNPELPDYATMSTSERLAKAKQLLVEAGFNEENPLKFTVLYDTSDNHKKLFTAIQSMWKNTLGVEATLENQEWKTYLNSRRQGNYQVTRAAWCGDYNEASAFLSVLRSNSSSNDSRYFNNDYDALMDKALNARSEATRQQYYLAAEKLLARDMPIAPIYQYVTSRLVSPKVGGYPLNNPEDRIYSKALFLTL